MKLIISLIFLSSLGLLAADICDNNFNYNQNNNGKKIAKSEFFAVFNTTFSGPGVASFRLRVSSSNGDYLNVFTTDLEGLNEYKLGKPFPYSEELSETTSTSCFARTRDFKTPNAGRSYTLVSFVVCKNEYFDCTFGYSYDYPTFESATPTSNSSSSSTQNGLTTVSTIQQSQTVAIRGSASSITFGLALLVAMFAAL
eukprot:TRINITY_DN3781_c0_g1_i2.p2 TRINITY_DN3781_c0_g1~~TRINITY_DN3781_c0_g1_i2.p2  ORF type:complete len:198 (+),score=45.29 TRINITY_DN3781_c0_g1_i2:1364-1957(+)